MLDLYTAGTPNGHKVSITLEELQISYQTHAIDLGAGEQKQDWFLDMNPNGRIPVIKDRDNDDFVVFESGAIMMYLADKAGRLLPAEQKARIRVVQWLMFQMGGIGPMMGQANVFYRYAEEKIPFAIERYQRESRRLLEVLDRQLADQEYLAGDYSIADIACFAWGRTYEWSGVDADGLDNFHRWCDQIAARPAVQRGLEIPNKLGSDTEEEESRVTSARSMLS